MPVRTQHGRAQVYRRVWGAPLRSPRRLVTLVVAVLALAVGLGLAVSSGPDSPSAVDTGPPGPLESPAAMAPIGVTLTANAFAERWVAHSNVTPQQWAERLHPFTVQEFWPTLDTVDPVNISSTRVTQASRVVGLSGVGEADGATVDVPTDAAILRLTMVRTPAGWRVASYSQAG